MIIDIIQKLKTSIPTISVLQHHVTLFLIKYMTPETSINTFGLTI